VRGAWGNTCLYDETDRTSRGPRDSLLGPRSLHDNPLTQSHQARTDRRERTRRAKDNERGQPRSEQARGKKKQKATKPPKMGLDSDSPPSTSRPPHSGRKGSKKVRTGCITCK
jgi:hypothetical protein